MIEQQHPVPLVAIACGGTGGHVFPGIAVGEQLIRHGCDVTLLVSPKEVDQKALKTRTDMHVVTLPAVGLRPGARLAFLNGFRRSYRSSKQLFASRRPCAVLGMGGFTSAPPILAGKALGARTFLHESNTIPGRANRWLSWIVHRACVGFPSAARHLHNRAITITGTPVRPQIQQRDPGECRDLLRLDARRPVVLVMGGSQGAAGINELVVRSLRVMSGVARQFQWFHLTGPEDRDKVAQAYEAHGMTAVVHAFFDQMELALGAATVAISRAGASSLAELAAMRLPAVLVPYPAATDDHQFHNARAFVETGAARLLQQQEATPEELASLIVELTAAGPVRQGMQRALARWHAPQAAEQITRSLLEAVNLVQPGFNGSEPTLQQAESFSIT
jgi:UDP-N-acetylglucosamine--N-acetylmuramyl-(pentapeptide) pyrophosphoryl-undecaprenol N-acetylglucosamine transferase